MALFEFQLEDNLLRLHQELVSKIYRHDPYEDFHVFDPKRRHIHKASVRDRVLHQAIFRALYPIFDEHFIYDSYSSRVSKGTHFGVTRLLRACRKVSENWRVPAYTLKCDIRRFFDSIDHEILRQLIGKKVTDYDTLWLIDIIFASFEKEKGKGLPLGNVTSQLFANMYLNELDQFAKHTLKARYYFRYSDDFVIVHSNRIFLEEALVKIRSFVSEKLLLELHPYKVEIRKVNQGIDFLGYVILPHRTVVRMTTKRRLLRKLSDAQKNFRKGKITKKTFGSIVHSYLGVLSHSRNRKVRRWVWKMRESIQGGDKNVSGNG
ncbi:MAG: reverse transcriptase domain-containing protein [Candidatus Moraniibacteriota bacterium]